MLCYIQKFSIPEQRGHLAYPPLTFEIYFQEEPFLTLYNLEVQPKLLILVSTLPETSSSQNIEFKDSETEQA